MREFSVVVPNHTVSEMIQKLAFKTGFLWYDSYNKIVNIQDSYSSPTLSFRDDNTFEAVDKENVDDIVSLDEAVKLLSTPQLKVGEWEVEVSSNKKAVDIGCQHVSVEIIDKIYGKFFE